MPKGAGIVGATIQEGRMLNIPDAYEDERFNPAIDRKTGYRTAPILCSPVRKPDGKILGAVQVINKQLGIFTEDDESLLRGFAEQTAVALENVAAYRKVLEGHARMICLLAVATATSEAASIETLLNRLNK